MKHAIFIAIFGILLTIVFAPEIFKNHKTLATDTKPLATDTKPLATDTKPLTKAHKLPTPAIQYDSSLVLICAKPNIIDQRCDKFIQQLCEDSSMEKKMLRFNILHK